MIAHLARSVDGLVADPDDGCDELFGFYATGDTRLQLGAGLPELPVSRRTAEVLTGAVARPGAAAGCTT
ncbi:hypothetical protein AB0I55_03655 [Actinocatenispora sera]|uniref:hypothetical protein n=1 Tax=Actinocatenispora sera TaxID=390989 RepID=UPI0033E7F1EE